MRGGRRCGKVVHKDEGITGPGRGICEEGGSLEMTVRRSFLGRRNDHSNQMVD